MPISGVIKMPGDKSISHRSLMVASLAKGKSTIKNLSSCKDVMTTNTCLKHCGIDSTIKNNIAMINGGSIMEPKDSLDCGNSGTTIRLLSGLLAGQGINANFIGDKSLSNRPMDRIIKPLEKMGVIIKSNNGKLPFSQKINSVNSVFYKSEILSSQVKSCILFAGLGSKGKTIYYEKIRTRDHTEIMLNQLGANISIDSKIELNPLEKPFKSFNMEIPGDPSSAAFFVAAAAAIPNSYLIVKNILANPTRIGFLNALEKMGGGIKWENIRTEYGELLGDLHIWYKPLNGITIRSNEIPSIIDEIPILAFLGTQANGKTIVKGAEELRYKECDRISAICKNFSKMGVKIIEERDGFVIESPNILRSADIETYGDHRIAMTFSIAGLCAGRYNRLDDEECMKISFPEFKFLLKSIIN